MPYSSHKQLTIKTMAIKKDKNLYKMWFKTDKKKWSFQKQTKIFMHRLWKTISIKIQKIYFKKNSLEKIYLEETNIATISRRSQEKSKMDSARIR